jgi:putative ABC transport system permease protein
MGGLAQLLRLGWRNIWRSRRRTLISMSAIAIGLVMILVYGSMVSRMMSDAKEQLDRTGMGHVEITAAGWRARRPVQVVIPDVARVRAALALPAGAEVAVRVLSRGLLTSAHGNEPVEVHGVDWREEPAVAGYVRTPSQGAVPAPDDAHGILVGDALARRMQLAVGDEVALTAQRADGETSAQPFRVRGVYHSISAKIAARRVLVGQAALQELVGVAGAHQIVIQLDRAAEAAPTAASLKAALGSDLDVLTYFEIFPTYAQMEKLIDSVMIVMSFFVYFLVGLGILNTMLMSVLERTREIGVMQALGTRPGGIVALVLVESFWIATLSVVVGLAIGLAIAFVGEAGLVDYSQQMGEGIEMGGAVLSAKLRTDASLRAALGPALFVYVMALVVGLIPAWRITRMPVVDALRAR